MIKLYERTLRWLRCLGFDTTSVAQGSVEFIPFLSRFCPVFVAILSRFCPTFFSHPVPSVLPIPLPSRRCRATFPKGEGHETAAPKTFPPGGEGASEGGGRGRKSGLCNKNGAPGEAQRSGFAGERRSKGARTKADFATTWKKSGTNLQQKWDKIATKTG